MTSKRKSKPKKADFDLLFDSSKHQAFISLVAKVIFRMGQLMIWASKMINYGRESKEKIIFYAQIINWSLGNITFATLVMNV